MTNSSNTSKEIWKVSEIYKATFDFLESKGVDDAKICSETFLMDALDIEKKHEFYVMFNSIVTEKEKTQIRNNMMRRISGEPLQYITQKATFYGYDFFVDNRVLIPRGDTEHIIDAYAGYCKKSKINVLDMCTGSGAIGITLKKIYPNVNVTISDISQDALEVAKKNIELNDLSLKDVVVVESDGLSQFEDASVDVLVSNPPYILNDVIPTLDVGVKDWEPTLALAGGSDGLDFYRDIQDDLLRVLSEDAIAIFEYGGFQQTEQLVQIFSQNFMILDVIKDYSSIDRVIVIKRI